MSESLGATVLVVDDNALNLKLTRLLLTEAGFVVETASDAEEALVLLEAFTPRVILMDLQLPGLNGFELTARVKKRFGPSITVVALTAYAMKGDEQRALDAGCDGYVTKPIDTRRLAGEIHRLLGGHGG